MRCLACARGAQRPRRRKIGGRPSLTNALTTYKSPLRLIGARSPEILSMRHPPWPSRQKKYPASAAR
eukprot:874849-Lingulodinium_polyedra.AAC.1